MIVDCTMFFNEVDLLRIRLHELSDVVDTFLILEGDRTFQGESRAPLFPRDADWIQPFLSRIDYHLVTDWPEEVTQAEGGVTHHFDSRGVPIPFNKTLAGLNADIREIHLRNACTRYLDSFVPNTTVILSDMDEIPRASVFPRDGQFHRLGGPYLMYYANLRIARGYQWYGARTCSLDILRKSSAEWLRQNMGEGGIGGRLGDMASAAWHLSFIGGAESVRTKTRSWRHPEFSTDEYIGPQLEELVAAGKDWWPARNLQLEWCDDNDLPRYLLEHRDDLFPHFFGKVPTQ